MAGQLHYVPASGYEGSDSFTYKANDGSLDSNTATVNVTVTHVNQAPVCSTVALSTPVNTAGDAAPSCTDAENDTLTYAIVAQPTHGTASVVAGQLHYVPASGYEGSDSFTYKANDGSLDSNTATVNVTVTHVNQAPVCSTVALSTPVNTAGDAAPSCTDAENDTLTYAIVAQPTTARPRSWPASCTTCRPAATRVPTASPTRPTTAASTPTPPPST